MKLIAGESLTVMLIELEVVVTPELSVTTAAKEWLPADGEPHVRLYRSGTENVAVPSNRNPSI